MYTSSKLSSMMCVMFVMAAVVVAMVADHVTASKVSLTNGRQTVTWEHRHPLASSHHHHRQHGVRKHDTNHSRYSLRCGIERGVPQPGSPEAHKVVRRSEDVFKEDARQCVTHEKTRRQILTGTRWCGSGNVAEDFDDIGFFSDIDRCCRTHDHCPRKVHAGKTKLGVTNDSPFTWSDCACDETFRSCLHDIDSLMSKIVGKMYFDVATINQCIKYDETDPTTAQAVNKGTYNSKDEVASIFDIFG